MVLAVKPPAAGKSRLRGALPGVPHEALALALALDTATAALACADVAEVVAVTGDAGAAAALAALGVRTVPEPAGGGLNPAFTRGAAAATGRPVAALQADVPALDHHELTAALNETGARRSYAADAPGTGTVLLTAPLGVPLDPRFGPGSAKAHAASGAVPLDGRWPTLRRDVDTAADLAAAAALGLGPHTARLVGYGAGMQGTVATYDPDSRSGTVLLDDGSELSYPAAAFDASGLRLLRLGQRVRIEQDPSGVVTRLTIPTMP
ncbi:2-phospho-L-lactate guanylyltransferase [Asanoa hainanensis]|uniref:2-phospho-L-lactate guanylyltransferase n=1 Tax=Asanoa hainanensis TaxID=560556 RepID=A0A239PE03_9ACTN|nr:2-phospho-L-lactate guanylyltransferase [Asanoa hainanensis]